MLVLRSRAVTFDSRTWSDFGDWSVQGDSTWRWNGRLSMVWSRSWTRWIYNFATVVPQISTLLTQSGAGYQFGAQIVEKFLHVNKMRHILRAHQLCNEGYQVLASNWSTDEEVLFNNRLSTVWSAPNYCYRCGNRASICEVADNGTMSFNVFDEAPENQIVLKEQASQNKVRHFWDQSLIIVACWIFSMIFSGGRDFVFMAFWRRIGLAFPMYTRSRKHSLYE